MDQVLFGLEVLGASVLTLIGCLPLVVLAYYLITYATTCQCASCLEFRRK